jgi:hypothetical protein
MIIHNFFFETEIEAMAFIQGVEFVSDSSLEIKGLDPAGKGFEVEVLDLDGGEVDAV